MGLFQHMKIKQKILVSILVMMLTFITGWVIVRTYSFRADDESYQKLTRNYQLEIILSRPDVNSVIQRDEVLQEFDQYIIDNPDEFTKKLLVMKKNFSSVEKILHEIYLETGRELSRTDGRRKLIKTFRLSFLILIMTSFTGSFWWIRLSVVGPLDIINRATNRIADGEYQVNIENKNLGDFASLAESFNIMSKSVKENIDMLMEQKQNLKKEIEEKIRIENDHSRLLDIIEETDDLIATISLDQQLTFINEGGLKMLNRTAQRMEKISLVDIYPGWALKKIIDEGFPQAMSNKIWKGEIAIISSDGNEIPIAQTLMVHYDKSGNISYLSAIARDISKQKVAEFEIIKYQDHLAELVEKRTLELQRREYEYRQLYDNNSVGLWSIDFETRRFERINEKAAATFDFKSADCATEEVIFSNHCFSKFRQEKFWNKLKKYEHLTSFDISFKVKSGEERHIMLEATVFSSKGLIEGSVIDVTKRKVAEKELSKAQSELLQTARMAGRAEIVSSILHNVGNVLNSVGIAVDVSHEIIKKMRVSDFVQLYESLKESELGEIHNGDKYLKYIGALSTCLGTDRLRLLEEYKELRDHIEHIGKIIRIQQSMGKLVGISERVSINAIMREAIAVVFSDRKINDIELIKEFDDDLDQLVSVDRHKIMQIIINLLSNAKHAVHSVDERDKRVIIRTSTKINEKVQIEVHDNGIGISVDALQQIFTFGFTTKKDGHGFGLHSCSNVAKELSGDLTAYSKGAGQGAIFTLILPCVQNEIKDVA